MTTKYVYSFGNGTAEGRAELKDLLGGKGANLAEMARMGVPVPPGFTIISDACNLYLANRKTLPDELKGQVEEALRALEVTTGLRFGDRENPLLVSVRSGARVSMPGMMDTILDLGLNEDSVRGLAAKTSNPRFAWDSFRRLIKMYSNVVLGVPDGVLSNVENQLKHERAIQLDSQLPPEELPILAGMLRDEVKKFTGKEFPLDPMEQLWTAIEAVFSSWNNPRAIAYREMNEISHDLGTAVTVQTMVFGNMGEDCGTGVAFSRDPSTGAKALTGEFLSNAQGEDIVAGTATPRPVSEMKEALPGIYEELESMARKLERHFKDVQDIEFTVQNGKLWILQTRAGKRAAQASIKVATDLTRERVMGATDAFLRITPQQLEQVLHPIIDPSAKREVVAHGLPASPGAASGRVAFNPDELIAMQAKDGGAYILVRGETSADDIRGINAAVGILTTRGGITSHAAVVARGMGKCCVVGASAVDIHEDKDELVIGNRIVTKGEWITIDGTTGEVIIGQLPTIRPQLSTEFQELMLWADLVKQIGVETNADTAADAKVARQFGAEGIGLCRTEHMFFKQERIDHFRKAILAQETQEREEALKELLPFQKEDFLEIFQVMEGLPVTVRLLDPPLHEFLPLPHDEEELTSLAKRLNLPYRRVRERVHALEQFNPMLGHRGCRLGVTFPEIYAMQVRAVLEAAYYLIRQGVTVLPEIMLPFVSSEEELALLRELVFATAEQVRTEMHFPDPSFKFGIMIELPRAALIGDRLAPYCDFFSFGTNDLTQTTYGFSRDDIGTFLPAYVEKGILKRDPFATIDRAAVGELMRICVERGKRTNADLKIGVCGEHGGDPESVKFFHQIGVDYVSCSPYRVPVARFAASQAAIVTKRESDSRAEVRSKTMPSVSS
ncbi:MAG: pyruvate, phosphate dikinase [Dehalococcoidia bacterium]|jgi:pyruvate,orthophosphate dikinase|nr:pyruvate, phosphate dikinase [Dehalococcoidia bacterium]